MGLQKSTHSLQQPIDEDNEQYPLSNHQPNIVGDLYKYIRLFTSDKYKKLITGYIKHHIYNIEAQKLNSNLDYCDIIGLIEPYANTTTFIWKLEGSNGNLSLSPTSNCPFDFQLSSAQTWFNDTGLFLHCSNMRMGEATFVKIYYELYCDENEKLVLWKGTKKYRSGIYIKVDDKICDNWRKIPELMTNENVKIAIKFLCVEWLKYPKFYEDLTISTEVNFNWGVRTNFQHKSECLIFSSNFDNNNWSLYCRNIRNPTNKKKNKFYIGLMLNQLPWFFNFVKIQLIIQCNDEKNTKRLTTNAWTGFKSSLQIPFKYDILQNALCLNISVMLKVLKIFDKRGKEINFKDQRFSKSIITK